MSPRNPRILLHEIRTKLRQRFVRSKFTGFVFEFVSFGIKQAWACLFAGLMLALLLVTFWLYPQDAALARYDFLTICAVLIQIGLLATRLETWEEAKVILIFHVVGTVMEIFKTHMGSWVYPEEAILKIGGVPLFTGFMYACVGSYLARVWRIFDFKFTRLPSVKLQLFLGCAIYLNFFAHHYLPDMRVLLFLSVATLYGPAIVRYKPDEVYRAMPLLLGMFLVSTFIWFAENLGTYARAWHYPNQSGGWEPVRLAKLGSWFLLMQISFALVAWSHVKAIKKPR